MTDIATVVPGETPAVVTEPVTSAVVPVDGSLANWKTAIPEEYRSEKEWETYKDLGGVLKSHINLVRKMGDAVHVPGKDAGPEEVARYRAKIGVPESPDKYDVKLPAPPEGVTLDDSRLKSMLPVFHAAGLTRAQAQTLVDAYTKEELILADQTKVNTAQMLTENEADLRKLWGATYEYRSGLNKLALGSSYLKRDTPAQTHIDELLAIPQITSHPGFRELMARIGEDLPEAKFHTGETPLGLTKEGAAKEIRDLMADPANGYFDREHPKHRQTRDRVRMLSEVQSGGTMHRMD